MGNWNTAAYPNKASSSSKSGGPWINYEVYTVSWSREQVYGASKGRRAVSRTSPAPLDNDVVVRPPL